MEERAIAVGRVEVAGSVELECFPEPLAVLEMPVVLSRNTRPVGCIAVAGGVVLERERSVGRVEVASGIAFERTITVGRVAAASGVAKERERSIGSVLVCSVGKERPCANGRVELVTSDTPER